MVGALRCECGYVAEGPDDTSLVAAVQAHASQFHGVALTPEAILRLAQESSGAASVNETTTTGG